MTEQIDLLLHSGTVVTMDGDYTLYEDGAVAVRGDSIVAVGPTAEIRGKYTAVTTSTAPARPSYRGWSMPTPTSPWPCCAASTTTCAWTSGWAT
jgi:hypothetical protein